MKTKVKTETKTAISDSKSEIKDSSVPQITSEPVISSPKKSSKKGCLMGCGLTALILIILLIIVTIVSGKFLTKVIQDIQRQDTNKQQNESSKSATVKTIVGKSTKNIPPYTTIDEKNIASATLGSNGGVLTANLPGDVTAYFIVPEETIIQSATVSLIPYTAMPTNSKQGSLSSDYGYGVQVEIKSVQMGVGGYLVFDTKGGTAIREATSSATKFNRCDPRFNWFDPYLCAKKNKLTADKVVTKTAAVVTPIFEKNFDDLVFLQNTIPTGIDGLIAMYIERGDVYIPQKLDKNLATTLIQKTLKDESSSAQQMEAAALALEWNINDFTVAQLELINELDAETFPEYAKLLYLLPKYTKMVEDKDFDSLSELDADDFADLTRTFSDSFDYIRTSFLEYAVGVTSDYSTGADAVEATAAISDAEGLGVEGADAAGEEVLSNIEENQSSPYNQPGASSGSGEGSSYTGGEKFDPDVADAKESAQNFVDNVMSDPNATLAEVMKAWELAQNFGLEEAAALEQKAKTKATDMINDSINDPNATISDLLKALQLAQLLGLDDDGKIYDQVMDRIRAIIEDQLKHGQTQRGYLDIAALCQLLGFDDLADLALAKANISVDTEECDLVKKNLSNYGINDCGGD